MQKRVSIESLRSVVLRVLLISSLLLATSACNNDGNTDGGGKNTSSTVTAPVSVSITGVGASFPSLLYQSWFISLAEKNPNLRVAYQSIGSGAGVEQFRSQTVDFGASDVPPAEDDLSGIKRGAMLLPMTAGAIVLATNIPGVKSIKLSRENLVRIFQGDIIGWNDPRIIRDNPGIKIPSMPLTVVVRSDGSGTTAVFTEHLAHILPTFKDSVGVGKTVPWPNRPNFIGAKGNEGIAASLQQTSGAIGYLEYGYATNAGLAIATIQNQHGSFVEPTPENVHSALVSEPIPADLRIAIPDPKGATAYPLVTYSWLLVYRDYPEAAQAIAMEELIEYGLTTGQEQATKLGYAPLPLEVRRDVARRADELTPKYKIRLDPAT